MKKIVRVMLSIIVVFTMAFGFAASAAVTYNPSSARDARLQALDCLMNVAFDPEYGDNRDALLRWEEPMYIYAGGYPTRKDIETLDSLIMQIAYRVPGMPNIYRVDDPAYANVTMYFVPLDELGNYVSGYVEGNWGMVTYWYDDYKLYSMEIGIASDVTSQKDRNHLIMEELINGMGLGNDHYTYADSIVYQPWTNVQTLSEVDWMMLNMVYSPIVKPGMTANKVYNVIYNKIME